MKEEEQASSSAGELPETDIDILKGSGFQPIRMAVRQSIAAVDQARKGERLLFPSKWPRLNRQLLGGFQPGNLYIIAGRPGVGKSAFSNQLIFDLLDDSMVADKKVMVLYWSFEMPGYKQIMRSASKDTRLQLQELYSVDETLHENNFKNFVSSVTKFTKYPVYFMNKTREVSQIEDVIMRLHKAKPDTTIMNVFDHSRLIPEAAESNEMIRLNNLSKMCMRIQANTGCLDILLSQLNREIEKEHRAKNQYQPLLTDLFGGDSIGQDAHVVMMLQRPNDLYGITDRYCGEEPKGLLACHMEKNRDGILGMIPFEFSGSTFTINERAR